MAEAGAVGSVGLKPLNGSGRSLDSGFSFDGSGSELVEWEANPEVSKGGAALAERQPFELVAA